MLAAGIVYQANIYPNHTVTAFPRNIWDWQIWSILKIPYWQVYGELYLDTIEGLFEIHSMNLKNNNNKLKYSYMCFQSVFLLFRNAYGWYQTMT